MRHGIACGRERKLGRGSFQQDQPAIGIEGNLIIIARDRVDRHQLVDLIDQNLTMIQQRANITARIADSGDTSIQFLDVFQSLIQRIDLFAYRAIRIGSHLPHPFGRCIERCAQCTACTGSLIQPLG
jgi:hypothetical protein